MITDFGRKSFITWVKGLKERIMDEEYICLSCGRTWIEDNLHQCPKCNEYSCRKCGGEVSTIKEYDKAMRINARETE